MLAVTPVFAHLDHGYAFEEHKKAASNLKRLYV